LSNNFSASHQAHQIAAHPFHHLLMGLPDDNPRSFGDHRGFGRHAEELDGLTSCWQDLTHFSAKNLMINSHQAHQIAAHLFHHLPMGLSDDNPNSFGDHHGFGRHAEELDGLASCWQDLPLFLSNFSAKNLLINSHQADQIAAHPFHHLPMGLPDDNPSSFGDHHGFGCHAGLDGLASCWQDLPLLVSQLFSQKPPDQQPPSTSDCCSSFSSSPNGSIRV
jgi:hypothetical protein